MQCVRFLFYCTHICSAGYIHTKYTISSFVYAEIYRIVSQKQIRDHTDLDDSPTADVKAIHVEPTMSADTVRKQCCQQ